MYPSKLFIGASASLLLAVNAHATTLQFDWSGVVHSTTDVLGNVFDNGAGNNTGVGTRISGHITWTDPQWNIGEHNGAALYDLDLDGNNAYHVAELDPFVSTFTLGNETFTSEMNLGSYYSINLSDLESGASKDLYGMSIRNSGYYQVGPVSNGLSDHVSMSSHLGLGIENLLGGDLINGTGVLQSIDWMAHAGDPTFASGFVSVNSSYWEGGDDRRNTGTQTAILKQASAAFAVTSFRVSQVPEPGTLSLFALGLLGLAIGRARASMRRA